MPQLRNLSRVNSLFLTTTQKIKACLGILCENQTEVNQGTWTRGGFKLIQVAEVENKTGTEVSEFIHKN